MNNYWKADKIKAIELKQKIENKEISIPKYQRGIVWSENQKLKLIETIQKGLPFGSILLYEDKDKKMQLIDGLQRSSTLFKFITNPGFFFTDNNFDDEIIHEIVKILDFSEGQLDKIFDVVKSLFLNWVKDNHVSMEDVISMQFFEFSSYLSDEFPTLKDIHDLQKIADLIKPTLLEYKVICEHILNTEIPMIVLYGEKDILPEVFERINSTGSTLTKYQIFSAAWSDTGFKITEKDLEPIINYVTDRYDEMAAGEIEISEYNSVDIKKEKSISLFDLCFGFGKLLKNDYPSLFGRDNDVTKVDSIGFNLINSCLGQRVKNMEKLHLTFENYDTENLNKILLKIIDTVRNVERLLSSANVFKGNKRSNNYSNINHTEYQITSIISSMFIQTYLKGDFSEFEDSLALIDPDQTNEIWRRSNKERFTRNVLKRYIIDVLNENWRGSGDKRLNNSLLNFDYYNGEISWDEFENELDRWFTKINSERKEAKKVSAPKEADRIILNVVYSHLFSAKDQIGSEKYDIEHILPKNFMKNKLISYSEDARLPLSSIGNLCLLPEKINRKKGDKTIYQIAEKLDFLELEEIEKKYTFTSKVDFDFIEKDVDFESFKENYQIFINNRFSVIKDKIKNGMFQYFSNVENRSKNLIR